MFRMFREHHARDFGVISRGEEHEPAVILVDRRVFPGPIAAACAAALLSFEMTCAVPVLPDTSLPSILPRVVAVPLGELTASHNPSRSAARCFGSIVKVDQAAVAAELPSPCPGHDQSPSAGAERAACRHWRPSPSSSPCRSATPRPRPARSPPTPSLPDTTAIGRVLAAHSVLAM